MIFIFLSVGILLYNASGFLIFAVPHQFQVTNPEPGVSRLGGKRLLSVLAAPKLNGAKSLSSLKLRESALVGRRYESSAAAVDSSDAPPAEKFEYQAEVPMIFFSYGFVLIFTIVCVMNDVMMGNNFYSAGQ